MGGRGSYKADSRVEEFCNYVGPDLESEDDYDSEGAASALIETLSRSLGITRSHLAIILRHAAFDGVYASTEQRTAGGGSLNLVYRFSELLGVEADSITGTWDHAHLLQVR